MTEVRPRSRWFSSINDASCTHASTHTRTRTRTQTRLRHSPADGRTDRRTPASIRGDGRARHTGGTRAARERRRACRQPPLRLPLPCAHHLFPPRPWAVFRLPPPSPPSPGPTSPPAPSTWSPSPTPASAPRPLPSPLPTAPSQEGRFWPSSCLAGPTVALPRRPCLRAMRWRRAGCGRPWLRPGPARCRRKWRGRLRGARPAWRQGSMTKQGRAAGSGLVPGRPRGSAPAAPRQRPATRAPAPHRPLRGPAELRAGPGGQGARRCSTARA